MIEIKEITFKNKREFPNENKIIVKKSNNIISQDIALNSKKDIEQSLKNFIISNKNKNNSFLKQSIL